MRPTPRPANASARPFYEKTVGADGVWGDFHARPSQTYEFDIKAEGYPETRIFRGLLPRSFRYMDLRLQPSGSGQFHLREAPARLLSVPTTRQPPTASSCPASTPTTRSRMSRAPMFRWQATSRKRDGRLQRETIVGRYGPALKDTATYIEFTD